MSTKKPRVTEESLEAEPLVRAGGGCSTTRPRAAAGPGVQRPGPRSERGPTIEDIPGRLRRARAGAARRRPPAGACDEDDCDRSIHFAAGPDQAHRRSGRPSRPGGGGGACGGLARHGRYHQRASNKVRQPRTLRVGGQLGGRSAAARVPHPGSRLDHLSRTLEKQDRSVRRASPAPQSDCRWIGPAQRDFSRQPSHSDGQRIY